MALTKRAMVLAFSPVLLFFQLVSNHQPESDNERVQFFSKNGTDLGLDMLKIKLITDPGAISRPKSPNPMVELPWCSGDLGPSCH